MASSLRWVEYELLSGARVFLTQRPDRVEPSSLTAFVAEKRPIVRFCFTDDYADCPYSIPTHWYPWFPGGAMPLECLFAFLGLMSRAEEKRSTIWLHCDSSSMRAPTFFGLYLRSIYAEDVVTQTVRRRIPSDDKWVHSCPLRYSQISIECDPGVKEVVNYWACGGEAAVNAFLNARRSNDKKL